MPGWRPKAAAASRMMLITLLPDEEITAVVAAKDQHGLQRISRATPLHVIGQLLQMLQCNWQIQYAAKLNMLES